MIKRVLFATLAIFLVALPAAAQQSEVVAFTRWEEGAPAPYTWVRVDLLLQMDADRLEETIVHEQTHVRQMLAFGSREAWMRAFLTGGVALEARLEAEALCETAKLAFRKGRFPTLRNAINHYAVDLAFAYSFGLTWEQAAGLIRKECQ